MYSGWCPVRANRSVMSVSHGLFTIEDSSTGMYSRLEAKMIGMTPAWLTLSGM